jgi:adenylate cyclase
MKNLWKKFTGIGVDELTTESEIKHIRLINILVALLILMYFSFIPLMIKGIPHTKSLIFVCSGSIIFLPVFFLNHFRKYLVARIYFALTGFILLFLLSYFLGHHINMHIFYAISVLLHFFLYPAHQRRLMYLHAVLLAVQYVIWEIYIASNPPFIQYPVELMFEIRRSVMMSIPIYIVVPCFYIYNVFRQSEQTLAKERQKSESLLHNIIPPTIADRLKRSPEKIADGFNATTILFADIVGFTVYSKQVSPDKLVSILNEIFSIFDHLTDKYALEKIKTIGDAYMVAGGIPTPRDDHAEAIANMALDMREELEKFNGQNGHTFQIRTGIHSGEAVAGVIGIKKFIYDLWGDTVNTASRMESHGLPGEIQVSEQTYELLKKSFSFEERGEIDVKGKGLMKTYLLKERLMS